MRVGERGCAFPAQSFLQEFEQRQLERLGGGDAGVADPASGRWRARRRSAPRTSAT